MGNVYLPGSENLWSEKMAGMNSRLAIVQGGGGGGGGGDLENAYFS